MTILTIDDLRRVMTECAGADESSNLHGDIIDVQFDELGYDSLALIETVARISQEFGIDIPDQDATDLRTPRELLDFVNGVLQAA